MAERVGSAGGTTLVELLDRAAADTPDRPAWTVDLPGCSPTTLTFAEVARRTGELASALRARGVALGDRVGVMLGNTVEFPLTWLALARKRMALHPRKQATPLPRQHPLARYPWDSPALDRQG